MTQKTRKHSNKYRKKKTSRNIKTYQRRHKRSYGIRSSKHRKSHYRGGGWFSGLFGFKTPEPNKPNASTPTDLDPVPEQTSTSLEQTAPAQTSTPPPPSVTPQDVKNKEASPTNNKPWYMLGGSHSKRRSSSRYRTK
jgi:hypothetical protein